MLHNICSGEWLGKAVRAADERLSMNLSATGLQFDQTILHQLTAGWGSRDAVSLYLDRCQVDTPDELVRKVWGHIYERRVQPVGKVVDFGAGDARFAKGQHYLEYCGFEIDPRRSAQEPLPERASLLHQCAFSEDIDDADVCVGNPPYVRNQDLPNGWRQRAADSLFARTGVCLSGLANAWQYFFLLGLASTKTDGLLALVVPYEWVSRPSVRGLREFIVGHGWEVRVYRLRDETFARVLTTSSITIVDKAATSSAWHYFEETPEGGFRALPSVTDSTRGAVSYLKRSGMAKPTIFAKRGLSPGTQQVLVLTEGERVRSGLRMHSDVVPCITSLRHLDPECHTVGESVFNRVFRSGGLKCWLIRTDRKPSQRLRDYLTGIPETAFQTATCLNRENWWMFSMPEIPSVLAATGFRGARPKVVTNRIGARAVGSVSGIYGISLRKQKQFVKSFRQLSLSDRIVPHSNGLNTTVQNGSYADGTQVETVGRGHTTLQIARGKADYQESRSAAWTGTAAWVAGAEW